MLLFHITFALASLVAAGALFVNPSHNRLNISFALTAAMLSSGTFLVVTTHSHLIEACVMGLGLVSVITYSVVVARQKLAVELKSNN